ncbi:hypothetical protein E3C22_18125 [Jiella endophytica]|uniref:Uncharacterized protein n=1 Tax=Jiella endophytica TaxID=2558362 RepID=A0A4Y8RES7_9HYPH|nr:hypothetical protein [Jiella endophytica]TFF20805.1 hypothetical protein E3C22_18125 [Jiella endophytica]
MKRIDIEMLLTWAYRQELPKAGSGTVSSLVTQSGWGKMNDFTELLTLVDSCNHYGCVPDYSAESEPHPDAVIVGRAVKAMADISFDAGEDWDVLGGVIVDGEPLSDAERTDCHRRGAVLALDTRLGRMPGLIVRSAMLGRAPGWGDHGEVARRTVTGPKGKPRWFRAAPQSAGEGRAALVVEIDGFDRVKRRPFPGAYQKTVLSPDPARLVADRLDYQAYVYGLADLTARLQSGEHGALAAHEVEGSSLPLFPWEAAQSAGLEFGETAQDAGLRRAAG